jgi:hypothetical protein
MGSRFTVCGSRFALVLVLVLMLDLGAVAGGGGCAGHNEQASHEWD